MVKKILLYIFVIWGALLLFMPKKNLYFKAESILESQGVVLNEASIEEGFATLELKDVTLYAKGIQVAHIDEVSLLTLLAYNQLNVSQLKIDKGFQNMFPKEITDATVVYSVISPLRIAIDAVGSFGTLKGYVDLKERKVHLDLLETKEIKSIQHYLTRGEEGWFYETTF